MYIHTIKLTEKIYAVRSFYVKRFNFTRMERQLEIDCFRKEQNVSHAPKYNQDVSLHYGNLKNNVKILR